MATGLFGLGLDDTPLYKLPYFAPHRATDEADARAGRICSRTGFWYPGHMVVYFDGKPYGAPNAPKPKTGIIRILKQ